MVALVYPLPKLLIRLSLLSVAVAFVFMLLLVAETSIFGIPLNMALVMAPFLLAFALFKGALARDTQLVLASGGAAAAALIAQHGSASNVKQWVIYKYAAAFMGVAGTVVILVVAVPGSAG